MNSRQRSQVSMLHQLLHFLNDQKSVWEKEVLIASQIDELKKLQAELAKVVNLEEQLSLPFAGIRDDEREQFNDVFTQLAGMVHSKYLENGQADKAYLSKMSPRELMRDSLQKVLAKANNLLDLAAEFKDDLESQPSSKAIYEAALEWQSRFQRNMMIPGERKRLRKQALDRLNELLEEVMMFLKNHLDMTMRMMSSIDSNFYNGYSTFRKVVVKKGRSGKTENAEGDQPEVDHPGDGSATPPAGGGGEGEGGSAPAEAAV